MAFRVAVPSWGVGTGGTRFARFAGPGEPRNVYEKLDDCDVDQQLVRVDARDLAPHPLGRAGEPGRAARPSPTARGLFFDSMNSNTFQDQPDQELSYKFGSLTHTDRGGARAGGGPQPRVHRARAEARGALAHRVDRATAGTSRASIHFRRALDRYLDSLRAIYAALPDDWRLFIEHKLYEPAFYSTVLNDWGVSYYCTRELGPKAFSLVDLGHHAPNVNIEMIVARLIQFGKLAGFHFNDSKYGDDDLDAGSIKPFQLFLDLQRAGGRGARGRAGLRSRLHARPVAQRDRSHRVADDERHRGGARLRAGPPRGPRGARPRPRSATTRSWLSQTLKQAFTTDVAPILAMARHRAGGAIDPVGRLSRQRLPRPEGAQERPAPVGGGAGIV